MRKIVISVLLLLVIKPFYITGQNLVPSVKISGLIKTDMFYDTRQTVNAREGHFLLYPAAKSFDPDQHDLNSASSLNFLPVQSNISVNISEIQVWNAKVTGLIEGDFFGQSNLNVNMLRLRHAYIRFRWEKSEILAGQYWHPFFAVSCYPSTLSFNTGSPIQPFSRAPQLSFSYFPGKFRLSMTMLTQRDYCSNGPEGTSSKYLRDSHIPEILLSGELIIKGSKELVVGSNVGFKKIKPEIKTSKGYQTSETVDGLSAEIYLKYIVRKFTLKMEGIYLENGSDLLSLGGYAIKDTIDALKGKVSYVPLRTASFWTDISFQNETIQTGIFAGYSECLGTGTNVQGPFYLTSSLPVRNIFRISPRFVIKAGPVNVGLEVEHTRAGYGIARSDGSLHTPVYVNNTRLLLTVLYRF